MYSLNRHRLSLDGRLPSIPHPVHEQGTIAASQREYPYFTNVYSGVQVSGTRTTHTPPLIRAQDTPQFRSLPRHSEYHDDTPLPSSQQEHESVQMACSVARKVTRIYLAAPLFSKAERTFNRCLRDLLQSDGIDVYLPQGQEEDCDQRKPEGHAQLFAAHLKALQSADVVVAVCDGPDTDSGTAWEMGYATASGIRVVALRTDMRMAGTGTRVNLMLAMSAEVVTDTDHLLTLIRSLSSAP